MTDREQQVMAYHQRLPRRIREYLNKRGIPDEVIDRFKLGWNGMRITIPIYGKDGQFAYFRLARDPDAASPQPKMLSTPGSRVELYGWERVLAQPNEVILCEGEYDRLVLEARGFTAVTSTGGAGTFRSAWAPYFQEIPHIYICFDLDEAGRLGERRVARFIPHARMVRLPSQLGQGGDVTDFFVGLNRTPRDFRDLLNRAQPLDPKELAPPPAPARPFQDIRPIADDVSFVKARTSLEWLAGHYVSLRPSGRNFIGRCPFHPDRTPSFVVFPDTRSFHCLGCKATGDCITFLMRAERLSFPEALIVLKRLAT